MIPILFEHDATIFTGHGLGDLIDCISCECAVNNDGEYELKLEYPVGTEMFPELKINRIVVAKANDYDEHYQAFRIYGYEKEIKGIATINCQHLSYDIAGIPVQHFKDITKCSVALTTMKSKAVVNCPFNFYTDIPDTDLPQIEDHKFKIDVPESMRACFLDGDDSIKGCWGGDLVFDNFDIYLKKQGGADRGTTINYGVDLIDLKQEENISEMITGVYPYFRYQEVDEDGDSPSYADKEDLIFYGDIQYASGTFDKQRIEAVDLTDQWPNQERGTHPSLADLNAKAQEYIEANDIGKPEINLTLEYAKLHQDVRMHDAITVRFPKMGIEVKSKVTSYKYDVLLEHCTEVEVGKTRASDMFSLEDASRLRKGLIPPKRIQDESISGKKLGSGAVGGRNVSATGILGWHLRNGSVSEEKVVDEAISTPKVRGHAVNWDKLEMSIQSLFVDVLSVNELAGGVISADRSVTCSTLVVNGTQYIWNDFWFTDGNKHTRWFEALMCDWDTRYD